MVAYGEITNHLSPSSHNHPFFPTFRHISSTPIFSSIWHTMKPLRIHIFDSPIFNKQGHRLLQSKKPIPYRHIKKYTTHESNMRFLSIIKDIQQSRIPSILIVTPRWRKHVEAYMSLVNIRNVNTRFIRPENIDRYIESLSRRYEIHK